MTLRHEPPLPVQGHAGETGLGTGCRDIRLRRLALRLECAGIQRGQYLALFDRISDIHIQMSDLAALRKAERTLAPGCDQGRKS